MAVHARIEVACGNGKLEQIQPLLVLVQEVAADIDHEVVLLLCGSELSVVSHTFSVRLGKCPKALSVELSNELCNLVEQAALAPAGLQGHAGCG
eukprot:CAMPEP_0114630486 /NCGR_PEP_ID=MMETSP0168-20121206/13910_1 /TAXON_ID=95228 ORGANISM="Vannella sp., Strain DIVA3 517/6/12" /NCGR_SAMPLE_ID=MMETSP0168 /ASSEMBLY_ACC=CAM_ASM_000044 /LENGTH=93 /DNA_ID=CAMNT_0001841999 /DNA_START=16 /DNA_END=293 /DNA_ORIENTATION=+